MIEGMGPASYAGLQQTEAIRESLSWNLAGRPLGGVSVENWLKNQGIRIPDGCSESTVIPVAIATEFARRFGQLPDTLALSSKPPTGLDGDIGRHRSGAGWQHPANFLITSAFVRLLGASEQFELDVLKCLFYYRPSGRLGASENNEVVDADADVFLETGTKGGGDTLVFEKPALWTWLRKHAENNIERRTIFKRVFNISTVPEEPTQAKMSWNKLRDEWYGKRNSIAHGRAGITMTLSEYIDVDVFVTTCVFHIRDECRSKHSINV